MLTTPRLDWVRKGRSREHYWGESFFDWNGLDDAIEFLSRRLRWWRIDVNQAKEKFGTARIYCALGLYWWSQLTHPGYYYNQWPKWTWHWQASPAWLFRVLNWVILPLHKWVYVRAYRQAVERWPHLYDELLGSANYGNLFEGKIPGYIHSDYWCST